MDFWAGNFGIVVAGTIMVILFSWVFGVDRGWEELHRGASIKIPKFFKISMKYITPTLLLLILSSWIIFEAPKKLITSSPYIWLDRASLIVVLIGFLVLIWSAWDEGKRAIRIEKMKVRLKKEFR